MQIHKVYIKYSRDSAFDKDSSIYPGANIDIELCGIANREISQPVSLSSCRLTNLPELSHFAAGSRGEIAPGGKV